MDNEKFRIIECTKDHIVVNRPPENEAEWSMMRSSASDAVIRALLSEPNDAIEFPN